MSKKAAFHSSNAPKAGGPYSPAIVVGNMAFLAGQLGTDPATGEFVAGDVEAQTRQTLQNLSAVLTEAGFTLADVVKTTVFLADMNDFARMNGVYETFFPDTPPARTTVQVARLPRDARIEIELIAIRD
jgi:2-iminobutanoate/2-iminopropanoate deaminase